LCVCVLLLFVCLCVCVFVNTMTTWRQPGYCFGLCWLNKRESYIRCTMLLEHRCDTYCDSIIVAILWICNFTLCREVCCFFIWNIWQQWQHLLPFFYCGHLEIAFMNKPFCGGGAKWSLIYNMTISGVICGHSLIQLHKGLSRWVWNNTPIGKWL